MNNNNDFDFKEVLQNKNWIYLLPMFCTLFFFYKSYKLIGLYVDDFFQTLRLMKQEEREAYVQKFEKEKSERLAQTTMVLLSFIAMCSYYFIFGDTSILNVFTTVCLKIVYFTCVELGNSIVTLTTHYNIYKGN